MTKAPPGDGPTVPGVCSSAERAEYSAEDDPACRAERGTKRDAEAYRSAGRASDQNADRGSDATPKADEDT